MPRTQPPQLYLGVDVGTTGTKVAAIDADGHIRGRAQAGYRLDSPQPGLYLQDATDWQKAVSGAVRGGVCRPRYQPRGGSGHLGTGRDPRRGRCPPSATRAVTLLA